MKIAVRSPNWIGDNVMALPAIQALKRAYPGSSLHLVCKAFLADIFRNIPGIDAIHPLPDRSSPASFFDSARALGRDHFDMGVLFTNSFHSALLFRMAGMKAIAGYVRDCRGPLLTRRVPVPKHYGHHRQYYLHLVAQLTGSSDIPDHPAELVLSPEERASGPQLLAAAGIPVDPPLIAVAPVAAYGSAKCWPPERFSEWIHRWQDLRPETSVLLFGSAGERRAVEAIAENAPRPVYNLAGKLRLRQAIILLDRCRLVLANDSGIMHLASGLRLPLVTLFGATLPQKTGPDSPRQRVIFHPAHCTPCKHRECPLGHECMKAIGLDEVIAACLDILEAR